MNSRVSNAQPRRCPPGSSEASQEKLFAVVGTGVGIQNLREQSPASGAPAPNQRLQSTKRRLDTTSWTYPLPAAKRARLRNKEAQQPRFENEELERVAKTTLRQPKAKPPLRPYASFLGNYVDTVDPSPPAESVNTFVSEWLESVGSDRKKRCRSDSFLHHSDNAFIWRKLSRSAPMISYARNASGFIVPPTPAFTVPNEQDIGSVAPSDVTGSGRSSGKSLVEDTFYRSRNLAVNGIYMRHVDDEFPGDIASLVQDVGKERSSPGPTLAQVWHNADLHQLEMGAEEPDVEDYFRDEIFPKSATAGSLRRSDKQPISRHAVPSTGSKLRVSNPIPDMLYGYSNEAFPSQQTQLISMGTEMSANSQGLLYPFFAVEFRGDGPGGTGSLWVATNQCLGGSSSCVNIVERLNRQLRYCKNDKIRPINSAAFSIAMNGTEARLYISWKHSELDFYMQRIDSFLLQKPKDYLEFRKYVRNII